MDKPTTEFKEPVLMCNIDILKTRLSATHSRADACFILDQALMNGHGAFVENISKEKTFFRIISTTKASAATHVLHKSAVSVVINDGSLAVYALQIPLKYIQDLENGTIFMHSLQNIIASNIYWLGVRTHIPVRCGKGNILSLLIKDAKEPNSVFRDAFRHGYIKDMIETNIEGFKVDEDVNIVLFNATGREVNVSWRSVNDVVWSELKSLKDYGGLRSTRWIQICEYTN